MTKYKKYEDSLEFRLQRLAYEIKANSEFVRQRVAQDDKFADAMRTVRKVVETALNVD
jgi:hypothetical protein